MDERVTVIIDALKERKQMVERNEIVGDNIRKLYLKDLDFLSDFMKSVDIVEQKPLQEPWVV